MSEGEIRGSEADNFIAELVKNNEAWLAPEFLRNKSIEDEVVLGEGLVGFSFVNPGFVDLDHIASSHDGPYIVRNIGPVKRIQFDEGKVGETGYNFVLVDDSTATGSKLAFLLI